MQVASKMLLSLIIEAGTEVVCL